jgi:hypothetical protein
MVVRIASGDLLLKHLEALVQLLDCNPLLGQTRSLATCYILALCACCSTLMADRRRFIALDLPHVSRLSSKLIKLVRCD